MQSRTTQMDITSLRLQLQTVGARITTATSQADLEVAIRDHLAIALRLHDRLSGETRTRMAGSMQRSSAAGDFMAALSGIVEGVQSRTSSASRA